MPQRKKPQSERSSQSEELSVPHSSDRLPIEEEDIKIQPTESRAQKILRSLTSAEVEQKTSEMVQYFLIKDQNKIPIRRAEIVKHVLKNGRIFNEILKRAARTLEEVFHLKVVEIDKRWNMYILINNLETVEGAPMSISNIDQNIGLLFVILSVIFMKGGAVREAVIMDTLKKLWVVCGKKHEVFGDVEKVIRDRFVRQKYLELIRIPNTEPVEHNFCWGQRAKYEVSKVKLLEFIGRLHNIDPKYWSYQYNEATNPIQGLE